jgi:N-acetylglucosamine kinase-like BadF-type ATPase
MLILGVDGGGTKTAALLADGSGQVVGWGSGGGSNYHIVGLDNMFSSVKQAVDTALKGNSPDAACYCMAAADMPHDFAQIRSRLIQIDLSCPFKIRNDVVSIFRAGSRFPYGVGVVCGTGFNAGGISKSGEEIRLPALGAITGDFADGEHLTFRAIGAAFRAWDGRGEPTLLREALLAALDAPDYETLAESYVRGELTAQRIKALSPLVFEVSEAGDAVARSLVRELGVELGTSANAILRRLDLTDEDCDVVLGGSVCYGKGELLMNAVNEVVHQLAPAAVVKRLDVPPVAGAVLLAADSMGVAVDEHFITTLRATLPDEMQVPLVM